MPLFFLRLGVSLAMLAFGLNQFLSPKTWVKQYLPTWFQKLLLLPPITFMRLHALGNLALGSLFLLGLFPGLIPLFVLVWWLTILPFAFWHDWTIGLRDLAIILAVLSYFLIS